MVSIIQLAAQQYLRTDPALVKANQPDVLSLHAEFLRVCSQDESIIKVIPLKVGGTVSTLQLQLLYVSPISDFSCLVVWGPGSCFRIFLSKSHGILLSCSYPCADATVNRQDDKVKIIALANSTNFDIPLGPTASAPDCWKLSPPPKPKPDFDAVLAHKPDPNWVPAMYTGEVFPMTGRLLVLDPRHGFPNHGVCDAWNGWVGDERINETYMPIMAEIMPSLSDTLLRNGGPYDARVFQEKAAQWAEANPGVPLVMDSNSITEVSFFLYMNKSLTF